MTEKTAITTPTDGGRILRRCSPLRGALWLTLVSTLLFLSVYRSLLFEVSPSVLHQLHHQLINKNLAVVETSGFYRRSPSLIDDAVLFPDWEVFLLVLPITPDAVENLKSNYNFSCKFSDGSISPAIPRGKIPSSNKITFLCHMPVSVRRSLPYHAPKLLSSAGKETTPSVARTRRTNMAKWTRLVYEAVSTSDDVIVFAKGINLRQGNNRSPADLRCVFLYGDRVIDTATVSVSAQEVFRCAHPNLQNISFAIPGEEEDDGKDIRVTFKVPKMSLFPTVATYRAPPLPPAPEEKKKHYLCACTMVFNVAKFLPEWITYHSSVGVEKFILYDNGSEDELEKTAKKLTASGYNVSTVYWPWPKTQESGFSHCAAAQQNSCTWMAFIDVDEFFFSPTWSNSSNPNPNMLPSLLPPAGKIIKKRIGQVSFSCIDFGPSGLKQHPPEGVTQGYTCRRLTEERHKSIVLLQAVAGRPGASLTNQVHHFGELAQGWRWIRVPSQKAAVFHYKYQAWLEFKTKFRRRVSAYVADWRETVNINSRDRTPGLGFVPIKPTGWENMFCEVNETSLRELTRRWFVVDVAGGSGYI